MTLTVYTDADKIPGTWIEWPGHQNSDGSHPRLRLRRPTAAEEAHLRKIHMRRMGIGKSRKVKNPEHYTEYQLARCATCIMDSEGLTLAMGDDGSKKAFRTDHDELKLDGNWTPERRVAAVTHITPLGEFVGEWLGEAEDFEAEDEQDLQGN